MILDVDVTTIDVTKFAQPLLERLNKIRRCDRWKKVQDTNARDFPRLLRVRHNRQHRRRAAEQRDELAAFHSITSSAATSNLSGTVRPSILAVLRLIIR